MPVVQAPAIPAVEPIRLPRRERIGVVLGYATDKVSTFDPDGKWLNPVPAGQMPPIPAGGLAMFDTTKGLVQVQFSERWVLLDRTELTVRTDAAVRETCADLVKRGLRETKSGKIGMGHGTC
jgi:hypothetical protein